jgi:hypothetical protein
MRNTVQVFGATLAMLAGTLCLHGQIQGKESQQGIPPRATPADYQFKAQAGSYTIAAEFLGHSIPSSQGSIISEEYVVVEAALFGPADSRLALSATDFQLRLNGKKQPQPAAHFGLVFSSLKDPDWSPPSSDPGGKSKTSIGGSGRGAGEPPPTPPKMPIELRRAMEQRVQKAALPEGDRLLPQAGLLFFQYRGKAENIHSAELTYTGPAGKAKLNLQ